MIVQAVHDRSKYLFVADVITPVDANARIADITFASRGVAMEGIKE